MTKSPPGENFKLWNYIPKVEDYVKAYPAGISNHERRFQDPVLDVLRTTAPDKLTIPDGRQIGIDAIIDIVIADAQTRQDIHLVVPLRECCLQENKGTVQPRAIEMYFDTASPQKRAKNFVQN